jgi:hypothetical protein
MTHTDKIFTKTLILTEEEASALKAALKAEEVSHRIVFTKFSDHIKLIGLSIDDIYCLIGCICIHTDQLTDELEDNKHFETMNMLNTLASVKYKCNMFVQHAMN